MEIKRTQWTGKVNRKKIGAKRNQDVNLYSICDSEQRVVTPVKL